MNAFSISPREMCASLWRHRALAGALIWREVAGRYRGSILGLAWSFLNPVILIAVYTFVFGIVFRARWNQGSDSTSEYALMLFAGLIVYNVFAECVTRAPSLVLANPNYVKKIVFPLEILPCVLVGSAMFHALVSVLVWLGAHAVFLGTPHPAAALLPLILLPLVLLVFGITWGLASLGVYFRDVSHPIGMLTTVLLFLSPVFYPASAIPAPYQPFMNLNPLTATIEQAREALLHGNLPDPAGLAAALAGSALVAWVGFSWFQKTRKGFADVL